MNMLAISAPLIVCFLTTVGAVFLLKPLAFKIGLIAVPGGRHQHVRPTPLIGGIAMFLGMLAAFVLMPISLQPYRGLLLGAGVLVFVGILDDFREVSPKARLVAQLIALSIMVFWSDIKLDNLGNLFGFGNILTGPWAAVITLFGAATLINAVNFIDGLDGLAGGCMMISFGALLLLALHTGHIEEALVLGVVMSGIAAFLCFNLRFGRDTHALVFMGDAGSMLLGFILAWFTIALSQGSNPAAPPAAMLWVAGVPLINMALVFIVRVSRRESPFKPSADHLHNWLQNKGFSKTKTLLLIFLVSILMAFAGCLFTTIYIVQYLAFWAFIAIFVMVYLGYRIAQGKANEGKK